MRRPARDPLRRLPLVLGLCAALGAAGTSLGLAGLLSWNEPIPTVEGLKLPEAPEGEEQAWARIEEAYSQMPEIQRRELQARRPALNALAGVNLIASLVLMVGALLARLRRPGGLSALRAGLVLSQAYAALGVVVQTWVQIGVLRGLRPLLLPLLQEGGTVRDVALVTLVTQAAAIGITGLAMAAQLAFYLWAQRWLRRPEILAALKPDEL